MTGLPALSCHPIKEGGLSMSGAVIDSPKNEQAHFSQVGRFEGEGDRDRDLRRRAKGDRVEGVV